MGFGDLLWFIAMIGIVSFPFAIIYLILNTLSWNEKRNIFSDSWSVFIAWLISGFLIIIIFALVDFNFRIHNRFAFFASFALSAITVNICAIAPVLFFRSRQRSSIVLTNLNREIYIPKTKKIWQASIPVSILTWLMIVGLIIALNDISQKIEDRFYPKNKDNIEFGIYDT